MRSTTPSCLKFAINRSLLLAMHFSVESLLLYRSIRERWYVFGALLVVAIVRFKGDAYLTFSQLGFSGFGLNSTIWLC